MFGDIAKWVEKNNKDMSAAMQALGIGRASLGDRGGTVGLVTRGRIDREALLEPAVVMALIPFVFRKGKKDPSPQSL